jgi:preprotein translocase subunit SecY
MSGNEEGLSAMRSTSLPPFKPHDLLWRVLITLGLLIFVRVGFQVPVPGMSTEFLSANRDQGSFFGFLSAFSGGAIGQTPIFALGLLPYLTAVLVLWMLSELFPSVRALRGGKKLDRTQPIAARRAPSTTSSPMRAASRSWRR